MAKRINGVVAAVLGEMSRLTKCLQSIVASAPDSLDWSQIKYGGTTETACFEAIADHHYSINVLNGNLLVDGIPPGFLPDSILKDKLYQ